MTILEKYKCDYCGQIFDDEDECIDHEQMHLLDGLENQIHMFDQYFNPISFKDFKRLEMVDYIRVDSAEAMDAITKLFDKRGIYCPYEGMEERWNSLFYWDENYNWTCWDEEQERLNKVKQKFENALKTKKGALKMTDYDKIYSIISESGARYEADWYSPGTKEIAPQPGFITIWSLKEEEHYIELIFNSNGSFNNLFIKN